MSDFEKEKDIEYAMSVIQKKIDEAYLLGRDSRDEEIELLVAEIERMREVLEYLSEDQDTPTSISMIARRGLKDGK